MSELFDKVSRIIDEGVNPQLKNHNGFVVLAAVEVEDDKIRVVLEFLGACSSCVASKTFTLRTIEEYLREKLDAPDLTAINSEDA